MPKAPEEKAAVVTPETPDEFSLETENLQKKLLEQFNEDFVKFLKRLSYEVAVVGLTEEEGCMLLDYDYAKFIVTKQTYPIVSQLFNRKGLEYKRNLIKTISLKARSGDDKIALWLLETRYPGEFGRKRSSGEDKEEDLLGAAISFVQKQSGNGIVTETAGRAFVVGKKAQTEALPSPHEILNRAKKMAEEIS